MNLCQIREESGHFLANKMREKQTKRNKFFPFQISNRLGSNAGRCNRNWGDSSSLLLSGKQPRYKAHTARYRGEAKLSGFGMGCPGLGDAVSSLAGL